MEQKVEQNVEEVKRLSRKEQKKLDKLYDLQYGVKAKKGVGQYILAACLILYTIIVAMPILLVFISAFADEETLATNGFSYFPAKWSLSGMNAVLRYGKQLATSYAVTILITVGGTLIGLLCMSLFA